jgi:hypothetical protein
MPNLSSMLAGCAAVFIAVAMPAHATTFGPPTPPAFPNTPYQASVFLSPSSPAAAGTGNPLGVTSITMANQGSSAVQVDIFQAETSGAKCTGTITTIGGSPDIFVMVPPFQTLQLTFPTPLVIARLGGQSCIAFDAVSGLASGNSVGVLVSGYVNN